MHRRMGVMIAAVALLLVGTTAALEATDDAGAERPAPVGVATVTSATPAPEGGPLPAQAWFGGPAWTAPTPLRWQPLTWTPPVWQSPRYERETWYCFHHVITGGWTCTKCDYQQDAGWACMVDRPA